MTDIILPDDTTSYWLQGQQKSTYPKLEKDIDVDVAIVGGGIAGMSIAYLAKKSGLKVAVVEKDTISGMTTGGTTGKVTAQHGIIYTELLKNFGKAKTTVYADAYMEAMSAIEKVIKKEKIDCGWQHEDNYVYTTDQEKVAVFRREAEVAAMFGLPASFETEIALPFAIIGAVKFANQAYFDAVKYTKGLAKLVQGNGSYIFENSTVVRISGGDTCSISTLHGKVHAKYIVVATKVPTFPLLARLTYAAIEYPETSYIVAGKVDHKMPGMYISPDKNHYSLLPVTVGRDHYLLVGGKNHIPGLGRAAKRYEALAHYAKKWFGIEKIDYKWKARDYIAYDALPIVGRLYPWSQNIFAVGGFKKWGLSTSMVAAKTCMQLIHGEKTDQTILFDPHRMKRVTAIPRSVKRFHRGFAEKE